MPRKPRTTARFWDHINGPIKIKLRPGQTVMHKSGGSTDEGYSWIQSIWRFLPDASAVEFETVTHSQDCDGRYSRYAKMVCPQIQLTAGWPDPDHEGVHYPKWHHVDDAQRDYSAEAMGY